MPIHCQHPAQLTEDRWGIIGKYKDCLWSEHWFTNCRWLSSCRLSLQIRCSNFLYDYGGHRFHTLVENYFPMGIELNSHNLNTKLMYKVAKCFFIFKWTTIKIILSQKLFYQSFSLKTLNFIFWHQRGYLDWDNFVRLI